uniref:PsbP C-terminal domain-containing protein n=1 Tax=Entomoneis paludosa TaxID=265537 RepID=A0A7S2YI26_9STRA|mmetsp:Transcript_34021/g.70750  ORF Transcript_34021/g.70750 Transcript_34021/m.70750 type:complete len:223 (+) Transcript_34021:144-812(+)|eukprot:CAMPEP_0172441378 /NCGR_PEP_ID=MMETSP1065-20121228/1929_1 /TAXON_ID=265537 /ORGANISM="Amphiprora paludosa, Strain CCMP125" /LENGTH=222 /DNA_ID=CAMNT_0013190717 /DNA_START=71 /DNA_END=739 /DNA_ORIENTATION=+
MKNAVLISALFHELFLASAWSPSLLPNSNALSRRQAFEQVLTTSSAVVATSTLAAPIASAAVADETPRVTTRMGGLLEPFQDGPRSIRMMAPSGWNKFDGEVGAFDLKWQDLVDPTENIKITSSPVKSTTESVALLGPVQDVGLSLASKRGAKLIKAEERQTDGIVFYKFDFAIDDGTHQLLQLCVSKGKLWSVDANAKEKRWGKREELYNNVLGSFMPKLA